MTTGGRPDLSLVLPCFNEAQTINAIAARIAKAMPQDVSIELVLVDNGSTDRTPEALARMAASDAYGFVRSVRVPVNKGYGHGIMTGLQLATGEYLAWSHADQQCDPLDVVSAYRRLRAAPRPAQTVVKGARQRRDAAAMLLTYGMQIAARVILGQKLEDINAQPKVFHHGLLAVITDPPTDFNFDVYVLSRALHAGWEIDTVPVVFGRRAHGQSRWAFSWRSRWTHIIGAIRFMARQRTA